jgi:hypothetical protein
MSRLRASITNTAATLVEALKQAEAEYSKPAYQDGPPAFVNLKPTEVEMRPTLFQPREFTYGAHTTDKPYVRKLEGEIRKVGELDPPLVIQLGKAWVCVDGHHRIEAYKNLKWPNEIKCEWFLGTPHEAVDAAMRRNRTIKLEVPIEDRQEQAWKRTLLGWGSKKQVQQLCGVSEGVVAQMRRIKARAANNKGSDFERELQHRLGNRPLEECTWSQVKLAILNIEPAKIDREEKAGRLARSMRSRLTNMLSRDPWITARALAIYDPDLPRPLSEELQKQSLLEDVEDELERRKRIPTDQLTYDRARLQKGLKEIEAELEQREEVSDASLTWDAWVREAQEGGDDAP